MLISGTFEYFIQNEYECAWFYIPTALWYAIYIYTGMQEFKMGRITKYKFDAFIILEIII